MIKINLLLASFLFFVVLEGDAQVWKKVSTEQRAASSEVIATKASYLELNRVALNQKLLEQSFIIDIPMPSGKLVAFKMSPSNLLPDKLKAKFPEIRVFNGTSLDGQHTGKFDLTPHGFHGIVYTASGTYFIDPTEKKNTLHQVYYKADFVPRNKHIEWRDDVLVNQKKMVMGTYRSARSSGTELRKYRLAVTCTGEYTDFHGGAVVDALAAIVTTINRVNFIYEREVSITFELIADNDQLIYTDASTDPYTNNSASTYIDEVQQNIDAIIGQANYDVGHGFSTGAGGLAGPGPCTSTKATGVTGTNSPIGDPFDVDFVAHEIGHQFGANHTFNGTTINCSGANRNGSTAYEPGSGTTIMAYAGICGAQNIQNNSDPYFHTISYDEILAYSVDGAGNGCAEITATGNNPPTADAGGGNYTIPVNTPFQLTGTGTDPDGDELTYTWEQFNRGPAGAPNNPSGDAPIFRSFSPTDSPTRIFPQLSDLLNNTQTQGEILPSYARTLDFRFIVRDNKAAGGGVDYDELSVEVSDGAGPFVVNTLNTTSSLNALESVTIEWDVANTNLAPVSCSTVNILLSTDGGQTFEHTILSNTANDGSEVIQIPNLVTDQGRIKVEAADNIFFDINNADFIINDPLAPGFAFTTSSSSEETCGDQTVTIELNTESILDYDTPINLSVNGLVDGISASFDVNPVTPGANSTLTLDNFENAAGSYSLNIVAETIDQTEISSLTITVFISNLEQPQLTDPLDEAFETSIEPTLSWATVEGATSYTLEVSANENFDPTLISESDLTTTEATITGLEPVTTYFWRVRADNICTTSEFSTASFATQLCNQEFSTDVPIEISPVNTPTVTSTLQFDGSGIIDDLDVSNLIISHSFVSDLIVSLTSPSGTTVTLFNTSCADNDDINLSYDDEAPGLINCPPNDGGSYQPVELLSAFDGESPTGTWTLTVEDTFNQDGGAIENWGLNICTRPDAIPVEPSQLTGEVSNTDDISIDWNDGSKNEYYFVVERSTESDDNFEELIQLPANETRWTDTLITERNRFFYRVFARNSLGDSDPTNTVELVSLPLTPSNLEITVIDLDFFTIEWTDNDEFEDGFIVERSFEDDAFLVLDSLGANTVTYTDNSTEIPTEYTYRVKAFNSSGVSEYSNLATDTSFPLSAERIDSDLKIFPNPSSGQFNIQSSEQIKNIRIFNNIGIELQVSFDDVSSVLDLGAFASGTYLLIVETNTTTEQKLILKQ